jgi:hypothetical protein
MSTYAVYWSEGGVGPRYAGRLELRGSAAELAGTSVGRRFLESISFDEISSVVLSAGNLRISRHRGSELDIGSVDGPGALRELAERLAAAIGRPPSATLGRP